MPLSDAAKAKHYRKKNKDVVREKDNLYKKHKRLLMKLNDLAKNAESLRKQEKIQKEKKRRVKVQ